METIFVNRSIAKRIEQIVDRARFLNGDNKMYIVSMTTSIADMIHNSTLHTRKPIFSSVMCTVVKKIFF